jgi:hypothetical protein
MARKREAYFLLMEAAKGMPYRPACHGLQAASYSKLKLLRLRIFTQPQDIIQSTKLSRVIYLSYVLLFGSIPPRNHR